MIDKYRKEKQVIGREAESNDEDIIVTDSETGKIYVNNLNDTARYQTREHWETQATFQDRRR